MPTFLGVWSLGLFSLTFFSTSSKKKQTLCTSADGWLGRRPPGPMPQLEDGVRHGFEVSRLPDFWPFLGGRAYSLKGSGMCQGSLKGVEFGSLAPFFSTSLKQNKKKPYVPLGHQPGSALWLQLCNIWASWGFCSR